MAWRTVRNSMGKDVPKGLMLIAPGKKERKAWGELCNLTKEMQSLVLRYPDAEVLLRQIMGLVVDKVSTESVDASKAIPLLKNLITLVAEQLNLNPLHHSIHVAMVSWDTAFSEVNAQEHCAPKAPYTVLTMVESESSGESYLPSHLFRTMFPETDPRFERTQTMKGIGTSRRSDPSLLILDMKCFDQRQRWQDTSIENESALFAFIVSDIMMVSISIFDIDQDQGRGGLLFKTIFKERTKLPPGLTRIVVLVRKCDGKNPIERIRHNLMEMLAQIWRSVNGEIMEFRDYIELKFFALPDENSQDFQKEVTTLKQLLNSNMTTMVQSSKFSERSKILWDKIKQKEIFDIPNQMMLLATLYCQQTTEAQIQSVEDQDLKPKESLENFTEVAYKHFGMSITKHSQKSEMYDTLLRDKEHQKMVNKKLIRKIQENYSKQIKKEFGNYHDDELLNYYERAVGPYVMIFTNLCQDLKMIDLDYFGNNHGVLRKELISYIALHLLSLKEEHARNALEAEQIKCDKKIEAYTKKLDQRTEDKLRREEEILRREEEIRQEKMLSEKEVKKVKVELENAYTKIDNLTIAVQCYEQNKDSSEKEKREIRGPMHEHNKCMCDKNFKLILQKLEENKCMCKKSTEDKYEKEDPECTKKEKSKYLW